MIMNNSWNTMESNNTDGYFNLCRTFYKSHHTNKRFSNLQWDCDPKWVESCLISSSEEVVQLGKETKIKWQGFIWAQQNESRILKRH